VGDSDPLIVAVEPDEDRVDDWEVGEDNEDELEGLDRAAGDDDEPAPWSAAAVARPPSSSTEAASAVPVDDLRVMACLLGLDPVRRARRSAARREDDATYAGRRQSCAGGQRKPT
jgi:hypothetical protein